ncbi:hypothetical protein APHAL10511_002802 [Amanita phalloides]|nr:hypothetical protein APHAL10511_002802 [Amanita phalloides]
MFIPIQDCSVPIANAYAYPPFTEPMVEMAPRMLEGPSIVAQRLAISEYLYERMLHELLYRPLIDDDSLTDDDSLMDDNMLSHDDSGEVGSSCGLGIEASVPMPRSDALSPNSLSQLKPSCSRKKMKAKLRSAYRRRMKRLALMAADKVHIKGVCKKRRVQGTKDAIHIDFCMSTTANVTKPGWVGRHNINLPSKPLTLTECVQDYGLTHFPWDGIKTHLLIDREGYVIGVLLGQPYETEQWQAVHMDAFIALRKAASGLSNKDKKLENRRGPFPSIPHGISFGGGQTEPQFLTHSSKSREAMLDSLLMQSLYKGFANLLAIAGFKLYGERNYEYVRETVEAIRARRDKSGEPLRRPYDDQLGVFPCLSVNLGLQSTSFPHMDDGNLAQSWCSITPLGLFNPKKGGHIILWDLGLVIDFPPGSTVLIPSALILHSNTSIQPGETRFSIVQYAAGGLFRWVNNGHMTEADMLAKAVSTKGHELEQMLRWEKAVNMFTKVDELTDDTVIDAPHI